MAKKPAKAKLILPPSWVKLDVSIWDLEAASEFAKSFESAVLQVATEALNIAAAQYPADAFFPVVYGESDDGEDPVELSIALPLGREEGDDQPHWRVSLVDVVKKDLEGAWRGDGLDYYAPQFTKLRDGLLALAAMIDKALETGEYPK